MTSPPRFALWLIGLFSPDEAIPGDLLEEFSTVASNNGTSYARRWFWRQSGRTIAHLAWSQFRLAPWSTGAVVIGAYAAVWYTPSVSVTLAEAVLARYPVYEYISASVFWWIYEFAFGTILLPLTIANIAARVARRREMTVTTALTFAVIAGSSCICGWQIWLSWFYWYDWPYFFYGRQRTLRAAFSLIALPIAVLVGGVIQRVITRPSRNSWVPVR
jgi:hypothetical protein